MYMEDEIPPRPTKRRRVEQKERESDRFFEDVDFDSMSIPSDTYMGLQLLRQDFPLHGQMMPVLLLHQLYTIVKDRTEVDREIDSMKRRNEIRLFRLFSTGTEDYAAVFTEDYLDFIKGIRENVDSDKQQVLDSLVNKLLPQHCDIGISKVSLGEIVHSGSMRLSKEDCVTFLAQCGLFVVRDATGLWFSIPNISPLVHGIQNGRKEIQTMIRRKRYKEILQTELVKKPLRTSNLGIHYHMRDMIGAGLLQETKTTCGPLLRLVEVKNRLNE
eukprot:106256_1